MARLGDSAARRLHFLFFTGGMRDDDCAQRGGWGDGMAWL